MKCAIISIFSLIITGCCRYEEQSHWLYQVIPHHRSQIEWYDAPHWTTWLLFGNDDDGIFGECFSRPYKPNEENTFIKAVYWAARNPLHNLCFYGIGSAHRTNSEFVFLRFGDNQFETFHYEPVAKRVFGGKGTSFLLALHGGKPFISLRIVYSEKVSSQFYFGWRERGNFGIKCSPIKIKKDIIRKT